MATMPFGDANRGRYDHALREIESGVIHMGQEVLEMIVLATRAVLHDDDSLAEQVLLKERWVDDQEHRILDRTLMTMAMENPVAGDFRLLAATFGILGELEKIGDEATKLAARILKLHGSFPVELRPMLEEISRQAQANLLDGLRLYSHYNNEGALRLIAQDDVVDQSYKSSRKMILEMVQHTPEDARRLIRVAEVFHAIEHVSDHTVDIAKKLKTVYERYSEETISAQEAAQG